MSDILLGDTLERLRVTLAGRYELDRELGRGGMAVVYLARDPRHGRQVAIKVLRPELSASLGADRFHREIKLAAQLQHPNILPLYDSGEAEGLLFYVMPYVEGESVRGKLDREKQLGIEEAIQIIREAADALGYAHGQGVVHRDIKPENILLSGGHVLVADFGIARAVGDAGGQRLTETGMAVGTPYYMSPEQAMGGAVDGRSDVYSLGCVLYELLAGAPPFTGPSAMAILARHSLENVPSLQIVRQSVPDDIEAIIHRALSKVPADRFRTMQEFSDALKEADYSRVSRRTAARPIPTHEITVLRPKAPAWRRPALAGAAVAGLVALGVAGYFGLHRRAGGATGADASGEDPKRIAVLYFQNRIGGQDSLQYLADGLTETLIHELGAVKGLQVISQNGVAPYRHTPVAPDSIARALRVGTLVSGTVAQDGARLRVNVALVNAANGTEIASRTIERPRAEVFELQEDLAKEVSIFLRQRLGQEVELQQSKLGTTNTGAWTLLQQADQLTKEIDPLLTAGDTAGAARHLARADTLLGQAEAADRQWVTPIVRRGWIAYRELDLVGTFDKGYYSSWIQRGMEHAERAVKLKPGDADALELRGTLEYWKWLLNLEPDQVRASQLLTAAQADLRAAVAANPTAATAWTWLSHMLMGQNQTAEAKLAALRAYDSDPYLSSAKQTVWRLFQSSLDLEDAQEANHWCQEGQRRFGDYYRFTECQIWLYALKGQKPDIANAWRLLDEYVKLAPPSAKEWRHLYGQMLVAIALARAGLADSAKAVATRSEGDAQVDPTRDLTQLEAVVYVLLGDRDRALQLLSTYVAANPQLRAGMAKDQTWWFKELRADSRYQALIGTPTASR
ncbi:MAG TPA: serine/threonine-protein kinase [Gemmatimonadales bacterium]|nr:serine/threonine-protein kinase [Gemmatimonadales bacterium]